MQPAELEAKGAMFLRGQGRKLTGEDPTGLQRQIVARTHQRQLEILLDTSPPGTPARLTVSIQSCSLPPAEPTLLPIQFGVQGYTVQRRRFWRIERSSPDGGIDLESLGPAPGLHCEQEVCRRVQFPRQPAVCQTKRQVRGQVPNIRRAGCNQGGLRRSPWDIINPCLPDGVRWRLVRFCPGVRFRLGVRFRQHTGWSGRRRGYGKPVYSGGWRV
jgi:hypothetical protein